MPKPRPGETRAHFVDRCIPIVIDDGTAEDADQAVAVCNSMWEQDRPTGASQMPPRPKRRYTEFRLLQTAGALRTALHAPGDPSEKREHLVVPVVALVEGVIQPVNTESPELVLATEIAEVAAAWNGEPATSDHPFILVGEERRRISANTPEVLEQFGIGRLFNAEMRDKKLHVEAWIDKQRALEMGGNAALLVARIEAGEMIEVSVGAFVITEEMRGTHQGVEFAAIWREIYPDHLALLPLGEIGACSNEMGCGAPRTAASLHTLTADGLLQPPSDAHNSDRGPEMKQSTEPKPSKFGVLLEKLRGLGNLAIGQGTEGKSDTDVRSILSSALFDTEPAFLAVTDVFMDDGVVIYETAVESDFKLFRRTFEIAEDDTVTFGEPEEVRLEVETQFVPVNAGTADCACGNPAACTCGDQPGDENMDKAARVAALIAADGNKFTDEDSEGLLAMSDATLDHLEAAGETDEGDQGDAGDAGDDDAGGEPKRKAKDDDAGDSDDEGDKDTTEPISAEAWLAAAPADIRQEFEDMRAAKAQRKADLVTAIAAADQDVYDEAALKAMSVTELENTAALITVEIEPRQVDYSGLGMPRAASASEGDNEVASPPSLKTAIKDRRERREAVGS